MTDSTKIEGFCRAFKKHIELLKIDGVDDIVAEIRAHLEFCAGKGELDKALGELGSPEAYAIQFREELMIEEAYAHPTAQRTLGALLALASRRTVAAIGLIFTGLLYLISISLVLTIVMELIMPATTGLWINLSDGIFVFGMTDDQARPGTKELLGSLYVPVTAVLSFIFYWLASQSGTVALKLMRRNPASTLKAG